ncbi:transmembrane protein 272-like isoform X2 [Symsagittifera roscoffensis]|uniref:transmembrane protein 272-like isoform X2 n=1 Tax=Symsagittifera roscoffensis TaxID=84072 RepID=UPI00307C7018
MSDFFSVVQNARRQVEEERQSIVRGGGNRRHHHPCPKVDPNGGKTVFEYMRDADETSVSFRDLLSKVLCAIVLSWPFLIFHAFLLTLPVAMIAIGGSSYNQCTAEELLPLWLIVFGIVALFCLVIQLRNISGLRHNSNDDNDSDSTSSSMRVTGSEDESQENMQGAKYFNMFMLVFLLGWFAWGNYLVFRIYPPHYGMPSQPPFEYCTHTLYLFSLVLVLSIHCFLILFGLVVFIVACVWHRKSSQYDDLNGR